MNRSLTRTSKFLSLVLRHQPEQIGLTLDAQGWASVEELLAAAAAHGVALDLPLLQQVVAENDKQRFAFSADGSHIRASQGHSVAIDLALTPQKPPEKLFHGTAARFLPSIWRDGLTPQKRQHVHLSASADTALSVGRRHGKPVVLTVLAGQMYVEGHEFFRSDNGVWLTERVSVVYLVVPGGELR